jgi:DNA repair protein SbcC/Rad50
MTNIMLRHIEITNFRSIKGNFSAPLDAKFVLIHGENGVGKTSLLSAIEIGLTGRILSLQHADPNYTNQLLHQSDDNRGTADSGQITLQTLGLERNNRFQIDFGPARIASQGRLPDGLAAFFSERCYLPQSLLGRLLQMYQEADTALDSPLSRFVSELLRLNHLDAIETGLQPVADLRNFRKLTDGYEAAEFAKASLDHSLNDRGQTRNAALTEIENAMHDVRGALASLNFAEPVGEAHFDAIDGFLAKAVEEEELNALASQRRQLAAIQREAGQSSSGAPSQLDELSLGEAHRGAYAALESWQGQYGPLLARLREQVVAAAPDSNLHQSDIEVFRVNALRVLRGQLQRATEHVARGKQEQKRRMEVADELAVARKTLETIDSEIGRIAENAGNLGAALAELSSFMQNDICPVCDRDFVEEKKGSLATHVNHKIRVLSDSAERLLGLSRNRGQQQLQIDRLEREAAGLAARQIEPRALDDLERGAAELATTVGKLDRLTEVTQDGARRAIAETAARRALTEHQSRNLARTALMATLVEFAQTVGLPAPAAIDTPDAVIAKFLGLLEQREDALKLRDAARKKGRDAVRRARAEISRRNEMDALITSDQDALRHYEEALSRASRVRGDAQKIRAQVETVRSHIIRREFNDRLNRLWRDLFVRLAPNEPFVPAFRIPSEPTHRLQPKLITLHRSGREGGTPGAMLSAGNLNTAALTLFTALHLTVAMQLPWLILDDPVQSMDDVHVSHFAALLRTLSKEHGRQVLIAVHDRQLFEYLKLELSPAFTGDSFLALELSRGTNRDTLCLPERRSFQEETAVRFAA